MERPGILAIPHEVPPARLPTPCSAPRTDDPRWPSQRDRFRAMAFAEMGTPTSRLRCLRTRRARRRRRCPRTITSLRKSAGNSYFFVGPASVLGRKVVTCRARHFRGCSTVHATLPYYLGAPDLAALFKVKLGHHPSPGRNGPGKATAIGSSRSGFPAALASHGRRPLAAGERDGRPSTGRSRAVGGIGAGCYCEITVAGG